MKKLLSLIFAFTLITSNLFAGTLTMDMMEYSSDANAQAAYVPSARVDVITQSQTSNDNPNSFIDNSQNWSQGFKVSTTDNITKITLYLNNNNVAETGSLICYIYSSQTTSNGVVPYQLLATFSTLNVANLTSSYVEYDFTGTFTPTANTQYHMVFLWTGFTTPGHLINIGMSASAPYGNGNASYSSGGNFYEFDTRDLYFKLYQNLYTLQSYSESTIKTQGSYALKAVAAITDSLNKTLTHTFAVNSDLTGVNKLRIDDYALRTGSNYKIGLHDTGGTTTEYTPNILSSNTWQTDYIDLSAVTDANKDNIDTCTITITNADSANTIILDYFGIFQGGGGGSYTWAN
jgi:hypothetical protein